MTRQEIDLLKRLISADRTYRTRIQNNELAHRDERGVEVGAISDVKPSTARSLVDAGLAEIMALPPMNRPYIFLGQYEPFDKE